MRIFMLDLCVVQPRHRIGGSAVEVVAEMAKSEDSTLP